MRRYHIDSSSARNHPRIDRNAFAPAVEALKLQDLVSNLGDGIISLLRFNSCMSGTPVRHQCIACVPFTGADNIAVLACRLQNQRSLAVLAHALDQLNTVPVEYFFIGDTQETQFSKRTLSHCH